MNEWEDMCPVAKAGVCTRKGSSWCVTHTGPVVCDCPGYRRIRETMDSAEVKGFAVGVAVVIVVAIALHLMG